MTWGRFRPEEKFAEGTKKERMTKRGGWISGPKRGG